MTQKQPRTILKPSNNRLRKKRNAIKHKSETQQNAKQMATQNAKQKKYCANAQKSVKWFGNAKMREEKREKDKGREKEGQKEGKGKEQSGKDGKSGKKKDRKRQRAKWKKS